MNDFQMITLATDHRRDLLDQARRERLARSARRPAARTRRSRLHVLTLAPSLHLARIFPF